MMTFSEMTEMTTLKVNKAAMKSPVARVTTSLEEEHLGRMIKMLSKEARATTEFTAASSQLRLPMITTLAALT